LQKYVFYIGAACDEKYQILVEYSGWERLLQSSKGRGVNKLGVLMWTEIFWLKDAGLCDLVTSRVTVSVSETAVIWYVK
jgi:hypothetical protein